MRRCRKFGPLILFLGIGVILAMLMPSSLCLFIVGAVLIIIGISFIRR